MKYPGIRRHTTRRSRPVQFHSRRTPVARWLLVPMAAIILLSSLNVNSLAQCQSASQDSPVAVRQEVERIFNRTLDAMETTTPEGVKATTWMPPDQSIEDEIKCLGPSAVPAIAVLLKSERPFGVLLGVRMLGWIGGPKIVTPLKELLESSTSQIAKTNALEALSTAPTELALPIIQRVLDTDINRYVREKASRVEARLKGKVEN